MTKLGFCPPGAEVECVRELGCEFQRFIKGCDLYRFSSTHDVHAICGPHLISEIEANTFQPLFVLDFPYTERSIADTMNPAVGPRHKLCCVTVMYLVYEITQCKTVATKPEQIDKETENCRVTSFYQ